MAKKAKKKKLDACAKKVKSRYKVWPSAYASGAVAKCRKVGAKNWGNKMNAMKKMEELTPAQKKLAAQYGNKKKITRGDVIAAAKKKKKARGKK